MNPFEIYGSTIFGIFGIVRVSQYKANTVGFIAFGSSKHQKQTSLEPRQSVVFLSSFKIYRFNLDEIDLVG